MNEAWLEFFSKKARKFEGKQQDTSKFRYVAENTFIYKGEVFELPAREGGHKIDRLVAYAWCRWVVGREELGEDPGEFVYPVDIVTAENAPKGAGGDIP